MKLTNKAIKKVNDNNGLKAKICAAFNASYDTVQRWIRDNAEDSKLTTVKAVDLIKEETGLTQEQILL